MTNGNVKSARFRERLSLLLNSKSNGDDVEDVMGKRDYII